MWWLSQNSESAKKYSCENSRRRNGFHCVNIYILDIDLNEKKPGLNLGREIRKSDKYSGEMIFVTNHVELSFKVFQGQWIFYVAGCTEERVYSSKSASQILKITSGKEISPQSLLEKLKSIIEENK